MDWFASFLVFFSIAFFADLFYGLLRSGVPVILPVGHLELENKHLIPWSTTMSARPRLDESSTRRSSPMV